MRILGGRFSSVHSFLVALEWAILLKRERSKDRDDFFAFEFAEEDRMRGGEARMRVPEKLRKFHKNGRF